MGLRVRKTLTVDEIYKRAKNYDIVLTAEASLADAINNRVESPRLGKLAYTPKTLIYRKFQNFGLASKRQLFLRIIDETDLGWKEASYLLSNAIDFWEETGTLEGLPGIRGFEKRKPKKIVEILKSTPNIYQEMESFSLSANRDVCVVAPYQFNGLDLSVLPEDYERLDIFAEEKVHLHPFYVYSSASQLVGAVTDNVKSLGEEKVGVVLHPDSPYDSLIRSSFRESGIEFQASLKLQDSESLRTLLQLFTLGLRPGRVRLKDVEPIINELGYETPRKREEEYLSEVDIPEARKVYRLLQESGGGTFAEVLEALEESGLRVEEGVEEIFRDLKLWEKPISGSNLNDLKYYLDSFDLEKDGIHRGVLLARPGSVAYIDRPVVFYLGMSTKWDRRVDDRPWKDTDRAKERNLNNFKALLQNGEKQFYLVQNRRMNREISPTTYFNELQPELSSFTDGTEGEDFVRHRRSGPGKTPFTSNHVERRPEPVRAMSPTALNKLVQCPRDYFFSLLVETPDRDYLRKGTVFHEFAEFYAVYPEFVERKGLEKFVNLMVERMAPIVDEAYLPQLKTEFMLGAELLSRYLEEKDIREAPELNSDEYRPGPGDNFLADEFDREINRKFTEMYFLDEGIGVSGKIDLLNGKEILDYKTGRKESSGSVVKNSNVDLFDEGPDFQSLAYLLHHREVLPEEKLKFQFFHVFDDLGAILRGRAKPEDYLTSINYYPLKFGEFIERGEFFEAAYGVKARNNLLDPLGREKFLEVTSRLEVDDRDFYEREDAIKYRKEMKRLCEPHLEVGRGKDLTENQLDKAISSILKTTMRRLRTENFFREDLDRFENFVRERLADLEGWRNKRFPVGDNDLDQVDHRDLILSGEGL